MTCRVWGLCLFELWGFGFRVAWWSDEKKIFEIRQGQGVWIAQLI